jgi:hypothetical protein
MWDDLPAGIELPALFINKKWVSANQNIKQPNAQMAQEQKQRMAVWASFASELEAAGFPIAHDIDNLPENTIHLTTYNLEDKEVRTQWKTASEQKITRCCDGIIPRPKMFTVDEFVSNPFFPAVFKSERANRGIDKFFIETPEQLRLIQKFRSVELPKAPLYKTYFTYCLFQQYITPPAGFHSSLRVLTSASGDVLAAGLIHNSDTAVPKRTELGPLEMAFSHPKSPYFLNCKSILSNRAAGGSIIEFGAPRYSTDKSRVLNAHGLDPKNLSLPEDVERAAVKIAEECNREFGMLCGFDFIYHAPGKQWYFLEANPNPSLATYALTRKKNMSDDYDYLDVEARREALRMCLMKRSKG